MDGKEMGGGHHQVCGVEREGGLAIRPSEYWFDPSACLPTPGAGRRGIITPSFDYGSGARSVSNVESTPSSQQSEVFMVGSGIEDLHGGGSKVYLVS